MTKQHGSKVKASGQNRSDTTQTAGKSFSALAGGVGKDSGHPVKQVNPDPGAYKLMPKKHLPSQANMPHMNPKAGTHKTC